MKAMTCLDYAIRKNLVVGVLAITLVSISANLHAADIVTNIASLEIPAKTEPSCQLARRNLVNLSTNGTTVDLEIFDGRFITPRYATEAWFRDHADLIRKAVAIDVETTGLNRALDMIIEVGLREFFFHKDTGELLRIGRFYQSFQDPGMLIESKITKITGITNDMVRHKQIDPDAVTAILRDAHLILAHNAAFDRAFIDRYFPISKEKVWGCSWQLINWDAKGFPNQKLETLTIYHGFVTQPHRALNDVDGMIHLLSFDHPPDPTDTTRGPPYLLELINNVKRRLSRVDAIKAPYPLKDVLKERAYRWNDQHRVWQKTIFRDQVDAERTWLQNNIYRDQASTTKPRIVDFKATQNYQEIGYDDEQ